MCALNEVSWAWTSSTVQRRGMKLTPRELDHLRLSQVGISANLYWTHSDRFGYILQAPQRSLEYIYIYTYIYIYMVQLTVGDQTVYATLHNARFPVSERRITIDVRNMPSRLS